MLHPAFSYLPSCTAYKNMLQCFRVCAEKGGVDNEMDKTYD